MFVASIVSVSYLFLDEADRATDSEAEAEGELCTLREILSPGTFVHVLFVVDACFAFRRRCGCKPQRAQ